MLLVLGVNRSPQWLVKPPARELKTCQARGGCSIRERLRAGGVARSQRGPCSWGSTSAGARSDARPSSAARAISYQGRTAGGCWPPRKHDAQPIRARDPGSSLGSAPPAGAAAGACAAAPRFHPSTVLASPAARCRCSVRRGKGCSSPAAPRSTGPLPSIPGWQGLRRLVAARGSKRHPESWHGVR
jgi:hypothetical protein